MRHGRLRRRWWRWRLRVWQRRLHRLESEYAARKEYGAGKREFWTGRWRTGVDIANALDKRRKAALFRVDLYRNLLNEMPSMRVLDGGKKDEAHG